jgi:hypothetical protein
VCVHASAARTNSTTTNVAATATADTTAMGEFSLVGVQGQTTRGRTLVHSAGQAHAQARARMVRPAGSIQLKASSQLCMDSTGAAGHSAVTMQNCSRMPTDANIRNGKPWPNPAQRFAYDPGTHYITLDPLSTAARNCGGASIGAGSSDGPCCVETWQEVFGLMCNVYSCGGEQSAMHWRHNVTDGTIRNDKGWCMTALSPWSNVSVSVDECHADTGASGGGSKSNQEWVITPNM